MRTVGSTPALLHPTFTPSLRPSPGVTWEVASSLVHLQQPSLGAENCPPPPADSVFPPQGTGCALALCPCPAEAAGRTSAVSQRWYLCVCTRGSLWEGLGQDPLSGAPEGVQQSSGPRSAECVIFRSSRCVCVCLLWEGAGRCCLCDLGKEENQREPRSQHSEAGGRLWESGHGF